MGKQKLVDQELQATSTHQPRDLSRENSSTPPLSSDSMSTPTSVTSTNNNFDINTNADDDDDHDADHVTQKCKII
jgi:hypothetical protein